MTSSAKSLLVFLPGWPLANYLAVSAVYVALAWRLQHATMELREVFLPNEASGGCGAHATRHGVCFMVTNFWYLSIATERVPSPFFCSW